MQTNLPKNSSMHIERVVFKLVPENSCSSTHIQLIIESERTVFSRTITQQVTSAVTFPRFRGENEKGEMYGRDLQSLVFGR